ncbi:MAG: ABC transporter substrate-binding protein [Chloroflexi bacterium]|nr:ABC transporter substrate-binding protein [Chloroflexota bacterium]
MKTLLIPLGGLTVLALLASCAPAAAPAPTAQPAGPATAKPAAPAATPKAAAELPKSGGVLKHAGARDEGTFDLHVTGRSLPADQIASAYSGLLQYDPEDGRKIIPDLAESYRLSPDAKKVTFTLRKNVRWHDGKPLTAADVKFNFDRWLKPPEGVAISRKEIVVPVEKAEAPDASTVEVYLKYPSPFFIAGMAIGSAAVMMPPQYLKDHKTMEYTVLGTGPFKLKRYNRGGSVELVKNEDYFIPGRPYLAGITQYLIPDEAARFAAFRTGQVRTYHISSANLTPSHADLLKREVADKVNVARFPGLALGVVYLNVTRPPFSDLRVRQAVDLAIDRKKMLEVVEGRGELAGPMIRGPWAVPEDELLKRPGYRGVSAADIDRAKALLAEAGHPRGLPVEAAIATQYTKQTVYVQDQLRAIGIDVSIKVVDVATLEKRFVTGDFAMSVYLPTQPIDEPDLFLAFYIAGGGRNYSGFNDKQVNDWYQEQSLTLDPAKRKDIVLNIQRRVLDQAPTPVLYHQIYELPYWKCVKGYYPEKQIGGHNNLKWQNVWLDEGCR